MFKKLKSALRIILSNKGNRLDVRNIKYLPRWVVLLIDISLILFAAFVSVYILSNLQIKPLAVLDYTLQTSILISINTLFFLVFKTYSGLIRHSSIMDALKLFLATVATIGVCFVINLISVGVQGEKIYITTGLILYAFISFSILFLFRLSVKQLYEFFKIAQKEEDLISVAILGVDENAISIASALEIEHPKRFLVKGFVSKYNFKKRLRVLEKPVQKIMGNVAESVLELHAEAVILNSTISPDEKKQLIEDCLEHNLKIYNAPSISDWSEDQDRPQIKKLQIEDLLERDAIVLDKTNKEHQIKEKTILVTGGAGSIGSEIVRQVASYKPKKLIVLDQAETPLHVIMLEMLENYPKLDFEFIICDVCNKNRLTELFKAYAIDVIYHAAAYKHVPLMESNPQEAIFTNIFGTKNVADLAAANDVEHFVMVSTDKAVNPSNVMGASKRASEMYVQSLNFEIQKTKKEGTKFITTRFGNVLGSNGSVVPLFKKQIQEGGPITITHPDIIRYFMTIPEACQLVLEAGAMGKGGEIFIFDMGEPVKIMDLAHKMVKLAGLKPGEDIAIEITGLRPGEKLYEELLTNQTTTLPTHHKKIMIAKDLKEENYGAVNASIESIIKAAVKHNNVRVVHKLKKLIPEFKSKNSEYESLDKEVEFENITKEKSLKLK